MNEGEPLYDVMQRLDSTYTPIEQQLFFALFKFNFFEIDSADISEFFLHELTQIISKKLNLNTDQ